MAVLTIRKYGDPILRRKAEPVGPITPDLRRIVADMIDTMYDEAGIGLAAPQVGIPLRLMVVGHDPKREPQALVNPRLTEQSGLVTAEEGCLSIPGIFADVTRAARVRLAATDLEGAPVSLDANGLLARVLQHELDHLDGVLFIDRLDAMTRDRIKRRIKKEGFPEDVPHRASAL
jgi:peptide deformylase